MADRGTRFGRLISSSCVREISATNQLREEAGSSRCAVLGSPANPNSVGMVSDHHCETTQFCHEKICQIRKADILQPQAIDSFAPISY